MRVLRLCVAALLMFAATVATSAGGASALTFAKADHEEPNENAINVSGAIETDDAFRFQTYLAKLPQKPITSVYLNSNGGSVQASMAIGRIINRARIRTFITQPNARCVSACTNIFLAGRDSETGKPYRVKGSANVLSFHNFVPVLEDKKFNAKDAANIMARAQKTIYELAQYYQSIDADLELLGLGLKQKDLYPLVNEDALRLGIHVLDTKTNELVRYETFQRYVKE